MTDRPTAAALVTGAGRRIGRAIALALAADGWPVAVHYHASRDAAESVCAEIAASGGRATALAADLADAAACRDLVDRATEALGALGCLVNNASVFEKDDLDTVDGGSWARHMGVNLQAPVFLAQQFVRRLPEGADGSIVNIIDERVVNLGPGFLSYSVSKAGLWALTQSLALSLAPAVRVNAIGPGPTLPSPRQSDRQFAAQAARMPLGRGATPDEIADGVRYILGARSMTGQLIALDGGQHLGWDFPPDGEPVGEE